LQPQIDLISALVSAGENGETLSDADICSICGVILSAGHETTANLISNAILALLRNREQLPCYAISQILLRRPSKSSCTTTAHFSGTEGWQQKRWRLAACRYNAGILLQLDMRQRTETRYSLLIRMRWI
jgi:hypothetical protein